MKKVLGLILELNPFHNGHQYFINKAIDEGSTVYKAAQEAINGSDPTNGCIFFYNPKTSKSKWLYTRTTVVTIGSHRFAK